MFVFLVLMLMLLRLCLCGLEQHKTNKWVCSSYVSAYAYASVAVVLTCYAYALVRTSLYPLPRLETPGFLLLSYHPGST